MEPDDGGEEPSRTAPSARGAGPQPLVVLESRARDLFEEIDPDLWNRSERNPIAFLDLLTINRLKELERDESFLASLDAVYAQFKSYMSENPIRRHRRSPISRWNTACMLR